MDSEQSTKAQKKQADRQNREKGNFQLPPLTFHALDLSRMFESMQEMVDVFACGSQELEPREQEALCASVICALFRWPDYDFDVRRHLDFSDRCARLLYAALYARHGARFRPEAAEHLDGLIEILEPRVGKAEYDLFEGAILTPHWRTPESVRSRLRTAMAVATIGKHVNGLFQGDPEWEEPDPPFWTLVQRTPERPRRNPSRSFAIFGSAQ